jgi:uncharacterized protein (DUF1800 family)
MLHRFQPEDRPTPPDAPTPPTAEKPAGPSPKKSGMNAPGSNSQPPISGSLAPIKAEKWTYEHARHLLWRAGFGASPGQIRTVKGWGPDKAVEHLLEYDKVPFEAVSTEAFRSDIMRPLNEEERGDIAKARRSGDEEAVARVRAQRQEAERIDRQQVREMQQWWLKRMIETPRPLEEKMTLFWHGHFATSYRTIEDSYHMFQQNQLFRTHAVGNYGKLLYEIIRDPAMIAYLDNNDSRKGKPNENLARELMELFSLGVGNYTEKDIKEGARALTGYTFYDDEFTFQKQNHDDGGKTILGRSGKLDGDGFVSAILENPACSKYMAAKLYRYFVADLPTGRIAIDKPAQSVIRELAATMVANKYNIKPVLKKLFLSEHFYEQALMNEQIKSPAELVVGGVRSLNTPVRDLGVLVDAMNLMGQNILFPPSVKGWDGGRSWINTATLFIRQNILCFLLTGKMPHGYDPLAKTEKYDAAALLKALDPQGDGKSRAFAEGKPSEGELGEVIDEMLRFTLGASTPANRDVLLDYFRTQNGQLDHDSVTGALLLITAMPEYQLC